MNRLPASTIQNPNSLNHLPTSTLPTLPDPFVVVMLVPSNASVQAAEYQNYKKALEQMLQRPPGSLVLKIIARGRPELAPHEGFPELGAVVRLGARLVIQHPPQAWDQWLIDRGVPIVAYPIDPERDRAQLEAALATDWLHPQIAGAVSEALKKAERVTLLGSGTWPKEGDGLTIGTSPFHVLGTPLPTDWVVLNRSVFTLPAEAQGMTAVGLRSDGMLDSLAPEIPFRLEIGMPLTLAPGAKQTPEVMKFVKLRAELDERDEQVLAQRGISRCSLVDPLPLRAPRSALWSPYRIAASSLGPVASTFSVLVAALRRAGFAGPIVIREHLQTVRLISGRTAMERVAMETKAAPVTWETVQDATGAPTLSRVLVRFPVADLSLPRGFQQLAEWLRVERLGQVDRTMVDSPVEALRKAFPAASDDAGSLSWITLKPWPLVPLPE